MTMALAVALVLAGPFEDTQKRFTVNLPSGWAFAPQPGDTGGASFRRELDGVPALITIRVYDSEGKGVDVLARSMAAAAASAPGYKVLIETPVSVGKLAGLRRRYVVALDENKKWMKMVEQRMAVAGPKAYVLHAETIAEAFGTFQDDFESVFDSFVPKGVKKKVPVRLIESPVLGKWVMVTSPDVSLELEPDGSLNLAGTRGVFKIEGQKLRTFLNDGTEETFTWAFDGPDLMLSNRNLGPDPIRYRSTSVTNMGGRWRGGDQELFIGRNGSAMLNGRPGKYKIKGRKLILRFGKKRTTYDYALTSDRLTLKGGTFGTAGIVLYRQ